MMETKTYGTDKKFLEKYIELVELSDGEHRLLATPTLQGRVLTSSADGDEGYSFAWLNYDLIASGHPLPHVNNWGGEDRFWLGPEGGQYSLFFPQGTDYSFDEWQTPAAIDTESWEEIARSKTGVTFRKETVLTNTAGNVLNMRLERDVELLPDDTTESLLEGPIPGGVRGVAFQTVNRLTNLGGFEWNRSTGMPSIWIVGQFAPSSQTTMIIPVLNAPGAVINDAYFGKIPADRLRVTDRAICFRGDGLARGKIGIPPAMTVPVCGALDRENCVLTIIRFSFDETRSTYVNAMWEHQADPFRGDVINAYNDGPLADGSTMGPFWELETSSPAANLVPGATIAHTHTTIHLRGPLPALEILAARLLGLIP
jgi:hypothetical protein